MNFEPIEASIVTQLQAAFTASGFPFDAKPMPDAESDFVRGAVKAVAFVVYTGSTSPGVNNTNPTTQERKAQFSVECHNRKLRGDEGINNMSDLLEKALIGFRPLSCDRLYLVKDDIMKGEDTLWIHVYQLECKTMLVQNDLSETIVSPNFTRGDITFTNGGQPDDPGNGESVTFIPEE